MTLASRLDPSPAAAQKRGEAVPPQMAQPQPAPAYIPNPNLRDDDLTPAPPFPFQVLPEKMRRVVTDCENYLSFPPDITAAGILAATALAIARTTRLYYQGEWRETACIYLAIVAPPGSAKSHPLKFALNPIIDRNKKAIKDYVKAQAQLAEAGTVSDNLVDKQCLFSDFTIEALTRSIQKNTRGISVYLDELRAWFQNFNRYNSGSEQEFWLTNWSGGDYGVSRMTKKAWLPWPSISVVGTLQPSLLEDIGKGGRNQNGFAERMLYCFPDHVPVLKLKKRIERSDTSYILLKNYAPVINQILDTQMALDGIMDEEAEPHEIRFEPTADDYITNYINDLKTRMEELDNEYLRNVYSKMQTYTLRFCLLLNRLDYACDCQTNADFPPTDQYTVTADQAGRAAQLVEYFLLHALKANSIVNAQTPLAKLPKDEKLFYKALPFGEPFTTSKAESFAIKFRISRAKMFRMLNETDPSKRLFQKVRHGEYERIYV